MVTMELVERDLEVEIQKRSTQDEHYPECEIWYILESIMLVEKNLLEKNRMHGDIRTNSIFISNGGQAKFIDTSIIDHHFDAYMKSVLRIAKCPLAPEQLDMLKDNKAKPDFDAQATEVWAIGIV